MLIRVDQIMVGYGDGTVFLSFTDSRITIRKGKDKIETTWHELHAKALKCEEHEHYTALGFRFSAEVIGDQDFLCIEQEDAEGWKHLITILELGVSVSLF